METLVLHQGFHGTTAAPWGANLKRARSIPILTALIVISDLHQRVCMVSLSEGSMISMYADGIL